MTSLKNQTIYDLNTAKMSIDVTGCPTNIGEKPPLRVSVPSCGNIMRMLYVLLGITNVKSPNI